MFLKEKKASPLLQAPFISTALDFCNFSHAETCLYRAALFNCNQALMTNLSRNSKQIVVNESDHHIHIEQPEVVVDAITEVIEAINKKEKLKN